MHNEDYKNEGALYNQFGKSNHRPFFFFEAGKQTNKQTSTGKLRRTLNYITFILTSRRSLLLISSTLLSLPLLSHNAGKRKRKLNYKGRMGGERGGKG